MATKKATSTKQGRPTIYTRDVILRFIKFMLGRNRLAVLPMYVAYNKAQKRVQMKHVPLLVAMAREGLNMTNILDKAGNVKATVLKEVRALKRLH